MPAAAPNVEEVQVPCSLFLGLNTEVSPPDLPEGVSPDCADVAFVPGGVSTRPCLHKLFAVPFPATGGVVPSVTWAKTFSPPNEDPLNLYQTSDGNLWYEDVLNAPGVYVNLATIIPGLRAQSVTCDGAEYIAASDGFHGADIPRQFYRGADGTLHLDRVSQDGPGSGPTAQNVVPGAATIASPGLGSTVPIAASPTGIVQSGSAYGNLYYSQFTVTTTAPHGLSVGSQTTIAGSSISGLNANGWIIYSVPSPTAVVILYQYAVVNNPSGVGGGGTIRSGEASLQRLNNVVSAYTAADHNFQVGWQVQISGIANNSIGGGISAIARDATGTVTVTTANPHGLPVNATVAIVGVNNPDGSFNGVFQIGTVPSPTTFTYILGGTVEASSAGSGNVQDIWNTTAFVQSILSPTSFTYQQLGADDSTNLGGTATIIGQISPGIHFFAVAFQTRSGYITKPSPPVLFTANGNSQVAIAGIPIGPANTVARILIFTGAGGANYFYIPVTPTIGTQIVGTSMVINDNVTTSTILDFSDTTLFGGIGVDIDGNNLFAQNVLGPVLGFFSYASRLAAWGQRNKIKNLLNMGFDGGFIPGSSGVPTGWTTDGDTGGGSLRPGGSWASGGFWQIAGSGIGIEGRLSQSAYQDTNGIAILQGGTLYTMRAWLLGTLSGGETVTFEIYSPGGGGVLATVTLVSGGASGFVQGDFSAATPAIVPPDTVLRFYANFLPIGRAVSIDELEIFPTYDPYLDSQFAVSYVDNFEAFDGVTGVMGPTSDPTPLKGCGTLRDQLQFLTAGGMHSTSDNGEEPSSWTVTEISNDTGLVASQAIDVGEECIVFVSKSGGGNGAAPTYALRIYEGQQPWKISQEVQEIFDEINPAAEQTMWLVNDIGQRRFYIGVPTGAATAPNQIYVLDYREIDTAYQIAQAPSIHISFTGKMIASDLARKWSPWNIQANCGAMLARSQQNVQFCLGGGNGVTPGEEGSFGNVYSLDPAKFTDDDYGGMSPYYTMYFFISRDNETALGVGSMRKLYKRVSEYVTGVGLWTLTPYAASLTNPWPSPPSVELSQSATEDFYHGLNVSTERMAVKFSIAPLPGATDVQFTLQHMEATVMQHPMSPFGTGASI